MNVWQKKVADISYVKIVGKVNSLFFSYKNKLDNLWCVWQIHWNLSQHPLLSENISIHTTKINHQRKKKKITKMTRHHQSFSYIPFFTITTVVFTTATLTASHPFIKCSLTTLKLMSITKTCFFHHCLALRLLNPTILDFCCTHKQTDRSHSCVNILFPLLLKNPTKHTVCKARPCPISVILC